MGAVLSIIFGALITSALINPVLPSLGLPPVRVLPQARHLSPPQPKPIPNRNERRYQQTKTKLKEWQFTGSLYGSVPPSTRGPTRTS